MLRTIKINKGLDISLFGKAKEVICEKKTDLYALKPKDFIGMTPKLLVEEGDKVKAGSPVFGSKEKPEIHFVSPVSGIVKAVMRGEKRAIEAIIIEEDGTNESVDFSAIEDIKEKLLASGCWTFIRQRPYSVIPKTDTTPKCIVIKGFDSSPLAPDYNILLKGEEKAFQKGTEIISKLTEGKVHLNVSSKCPLDFIPSCEKLQVNYFEGKHPCGNVSVQIEKLDPINKGERIWYIDATDIITVGKLFLTGKYVSDKIVALTGGEVKQTGYYKIKRGACIKPLIEENVSTTKHLRFISGNVLTGTKVEADGFMSFYDNQITVISEGDNYEPFGWILPGFKKFSISRTFPYGFLRLICNKPVKVNANLHGGKRAFVFTGEFEKVLPMNIYPMQLIKACIIEDIDQMEQLGIYEIDSEDFALCEVIDPSKTEIQQIIRNGLELMRKEMGE